MRIFVQKSIQHYQNNTGKKKTGFQIIKGKNGEVEKIQGFTTDNNQVLHIQHQKFKKNENTGLIKHRYKIFKIKSSNLLKLMHDSNSKMKTTDNEKKKIMNLESLTKKPVKKESSKLKTKKPVKKESSKLKTKKPVKEDTKPKTKKPVKKESSKLKTKKPKDNTKLKTKKTVKVSSKSMPNKGVNQNEK